MNGLIRPIARTDLRHLRPFAAEARVAGVPAWISLGNYINFAGGRNGSHRHSYYEVCLALGGRGRFDAGGRSWPLRPGDLFIARPGEVHEIVSARRPPLEVCFVSFAFGPARAGDGEGAALVRAFESADRAVVPDSGGLARLFAVLVGAADGDGLVRAQLAAALVLEIMTRTVPPSPASREAAPDPRLGLAFRFMQDNLSRPLSVAELARQACTSERTLRRLFAAACGRTVVEEFRRRRLEAAAALLIADPQRSVASVGAEMGYGDPAQFGREFRRFSGLSPARFRREGGTVFTGPQAG